MYQRHCANAMSSGDFHQDGLHIFVRAWRLEAHAENEDQLHHVRLCIEGIPVHGWNNYVAFSIIGRGCSLDYIESKPLLREDTRYLALWAWIANPDAIPKLKWLTLPARGERRRGRRGLQHRVLIHLDLHEDHSRAREDDDNSPAPVVHEFSWHSGIVEGGRRAPLLRLFGMAIVTSDATRRTIVTTIGAEEGQEAIRDLASTFVGLCPATRGSAIAGRTRTAPATFWCRLSPRRRAHGTACANQCLGPGEGAQPRAPGFAAICSPSLAR
uniref:Predicted protein n=1 Tax=Hordeum vulgare subsp. vulgare TaxID=112509 RepID=F2ECD9_HORVV|nr:predicted protein [Hordeum vulgare subsp. vulgare]